MKQKWSEPEIRFLKENYESMTCGEIATKLNRSTRSVQHKFNQEHLQKKRCVVGDIVNGWLIQEIYFKTIGSQNVSYAKCISTIDNIKEQEFRLTKLNLKQVGWPDRRRPDNTERNTTHGLCNHRLYRIWASMRNRCVNERNIGHKDYGQRGICVCKEWNDDFLTFYNWAIENGYHDSLTLDRIDVNGNYEPSNCRWATRGQQMANKRNAVVMIITAFDETKSVYEWASDKRCMVKCPVLQYRITAGWNPEDAITKPPERKGKKTLSNWLKDKYPDIYTEYHSNTVPS